MLDRITRFLTQAYIFLGLYIVSFFSFNPHLAAQQSSFNVKNRPSNVRFPPKPWDFFFGGSGGSGGPGGGGGGGGGWASGRRPGNGPYKRIGRVDDVRAPECGSCCG